MIGTIVFVPIESIVERYSAQWRVWFEKAFRTECKGRGLRLEVVGDDEPKVIREGQFLDVAGTLKYKHGQLLAIHQQMGKWIKRGPVKLFFGDLWFPGIESLFYYRTLTKAPIKIYGQLHAGTWDPHDYLYQKGCKPWARPLETSWLSEFDRIYVATDFHKRLIRASVRVESGPFRVMPWPVAVPAPGEVRLSKKENIVVFPHRLAPEKRPQDFERVRDQFKDRFNTKVEWVKSVEVCKSKKDYYALLAKAKVAFSSAAQETFGIAMQEAVNYACFPVAPNRLAYPETLKGYKLYENLDEAVEMIAAFFKNPELHYPGYTPKEAEKIVRDVCSTR